MHNAVGFNSSQSKAILFGAGPMLVIAGPGSGKTLVITHRIKNLIFEKKVKPENILVVTFTKAAAIEMQYRFCALTSDYNRSLPVNFGTCHAIFFQIIREATSLNAGSILKESEKREILEEILASQEKKENFILEPSLETIQRLLSDFSKIKNTGVSPEEYEISYCENEEFSFLFYAYKKECFRRQRLDFDDMQSECLELLKSNKKLLEKYQKAFSYILVDEFQDINPVQYEIIKLLSATDNNIFVVGDDDQSIYGFRGATPNIMKLFMEEYKGAVKVELNENYRSAKEIVQASNRLISKNENRFIKNPESKVALKGQVKYFAFESRQDMYQSIGECIEQYMKKEERSYEDIAVLFRTNANAGILIAELLKRGIPYTCKERITNIYETEIAKDILAYIKLALNKKDVKAFYRIMNRPSRYIKRKLVPIKPFTKEEIIALQENQNVIHLLLQLYKQLDFIEMMEPYPAINYIRKGIGYDSYIREQALYSNQDINALMDILDEITETSKGFRSLKEWIYFAEHYGDNIKKGYDTKNGVSISTMHGAKGLEWRFVIIPDVNEGIIPHKKAFIKEEVEEERRVFYVAATRAKEFLYFFFVKTKKTDQTGQPSRFLSECMDK